jgi:hypothetical protein
VLVEVPKKNGKSELAAAIALSPVNSQAKESLGYPTQKPLSLLERIIKTSSNDNDIVLDAFCGCGTALVSAQRLDRQWIGIDISPTACRVMATRLQRDCKLPEDERLWRIGRGFVVRDLPRTEAEFDAYLRSSSRIGRSLLSVESRTRRKSATWV